MSDFAACARRALEDRGLTMRGAARALKYDPGYLSRVLNGKQRPSRQLAEALDALVEAGGELAAKAVGIGCGDVRRPREETPGTDIGHIREAVAHFLEHDGRYGGDAVASAATQVWRAGQRELESGTVPERLEREYVAAVAEAAEVAGWLAFDAGRQESSRAGFLEAHLLARHAGDRPMQWFALDMLAMHGIQYGHPRETLRIADEVLTQLRVPPRVALLARVRKGRALALAGSRTGALSELEAARAGLGESLDPRDPPWTWWVDELEVAGHRGEVLLALGDADAAVPELRRALELAAAVRPVGRGVLYYQVALFAAHAKARDWRACEATLAAVQPLLELVSSGRSRRRLWGTVRDIESAPGVPGRLLEASACLCEYVTGGPVPLARRHHAP
ncbi:helix-turn-helix domain-containing protein [Streptomyces gamaensis]|uniref:Helix-turn-helix domain-containing protein n=1 Tax=Streptomyces gamaensis TaxID=1763542 RepID=A0ABW0YUT4_9ACTN